MTKNLWYITKYFAPQTTKNRGGRDFLLLTAMAKNSVNITVITSDSNNVVEVPKLNQSVTFETVHGIEIIWLKTLKYQVAKSAKRILSWFHFEWNIFALNKTNLAKPDAIIVSSLSLLTVINGILLKKKYQCPLIFEVRDIWPLTLTEEGGFSQYNPFILLLAWVEKRGYKHADIIVGTMPNLQAHVRSILGYEKVVHCIPMGINDEMLDVKTNLLPQEYINEYVPNNKFIVTYAGTIGITNALDVFFQSAKILQEHSDIHFLIVGDGALKEYFIKEYGGLNNITFAPKVSRDEVQSILHKSDLLYFSVFPSKVWDYGQSLNKIIDYMLAEKPILASYNGYPSMINEAQSGEFLPAGDVTTLCEKIIEYSLLSIEDREKIGKNGKNWLTKNHHYTILSKKYIDILFSQKENHHE